MTTTQIDAPTLSRTARIGAIASLRVTGPGLLRSSYRLSPASNQSAKRTPSESH
jgi:hypothetical protein